MKIEIISCLKDNYSYVIIDEKNKKTCVVDPSESKPIVNFLEKNNLNLLMQVVLRKQLLRGTLYIVRSIYVEKSGIFLET